MRTARVGVGLVVLVLVVAACGGGGSAGETEAAPSGTEAEATPSGVDGGEISITLVGERSAFDATRLTAQAGAEVTITFMNRDARVPHNLRIDGPAGKIATDIASGPTTQTLTFTIDEPGTYKFFCEVHPTAMVGQLVIEG